ncbi:hypothetical protein PybrP1_013123 [[Pythium] brassicae (nom. inval.)]|nr:hypothetical protein PybrP1_013123 [[Pythium] brassicae (nom. inval.)]
MIFTNKQNAEEAPPHEASAPRQLREARPMPQHNVQRALTVDSEKSRADAKHLRKIVRMYHQDNAYNMDETALFYRALPWISLCLVRAPALKQHEDGITMVVAANADTSDKLSLLFLGRSKRPRWLARTPKIVGYVSTSRSWMTF